MFKETTRTWSWSKGNTANQFYCKSRSRWKQKKYSIIEEAEETIFRFFTKTAKEFWTYFNLVKYHYKTTEYNTLNVKLYNSHLNKLQSWTKNGTGVIFIECCWWIKW